MLNRRDFLLRAGQVGYAMAIVGPSLDDLLRPATASAEELSARELSSDAAEADLSSFYSGMRWRMLGPVRGGRVAAATGVTGRPDEFYFGSVNGGVWKSIDAGRVWLPVFDSQPVASIGAIAVSASSPDTVYVGSGESTLRD